MDLYHGKFFALIDITSFKFSWLLSILTNNYLLEWKKCKKDAASANKDLIVTLSNVDNIKSQANVSALEHLLKPKMIAMYDSLANNNKYAQVTSNAIVFY